MSNFKDVSVDTKCFVDNRHGWYITYIKRFTKTQVITSRKGKNYNYEEKWRVASGDKIGNGRWEYDMLEIFSEKHQKIVDAYQHECKVKEVLNSLDKVKSKITKEELSKLQDILLRLVNF